MLNPASLFDQEKLLVVRGGNRDGVGAIARGIKRTGQIGCP